MRRALVAGACLAALAVPASTAASAAPSFRVTITAGEDMTIELAHEAGCVEHLARHLEIRNAKPLTLTAAKLGVARNFLFELTVTERRSDVYDAGCDLTHEPPTSSCGTVAYTVGSVGTGVGFLNKKTDKFILFYTRISTDPFAGSCGVNAWGVAETPGSTGKVWVDNFAPYPLNHDATTTVDRAKLTARKPFAVQWGGAGDFGEGSRTGHVSASWTVALAPIS